MRAGLRISWKEAVWCTSAADSLVANVEVDDTVITRTTREQGLKPWERWSLLMAISWKNWRNVRWWHGGHSMRYENCCATTKWHCDIYCAWRHLGSRQYCTGVLAAGFRLSHNAPTCAQSKTIYWDEGYTFPGTPLHSTETPEAHMMRSPKLLHNCRRKHKILHGVKMFFGSYLSGPAAGKAEKIRSGYGIWRQGSDPSVMDVGSGCGDGSSSLRGSRWMRWLSRKTKDGGSKCQSHPRLKTQHVCTWLLRMHTWDTQNMQKTAAKQVIRMRMRMKTTTHGPALLVSRWLQTSDTTEPAGLGGMQVHCRALDISVHLHGMVSRKDAQIEVCGPCAYMLAGVERRGATAKRPGSLRVWHSM